MRKIMLLFSNININDRTKIKPGKHLTYNFLMNSTWMDIILYVKRENEEIAKGLKNKSDPNIDLTIDEINEYIQYINSGSNNYKERINLDKDYLALFENIIDEYNKIQENIYDSDKDPVINYLASFEGFSE